MDRAKELTARSVRNMSQWASDSFVHAQRGWSLVSFGVWVGVTAAIVLYLPYERAMEADMRFQETNAQLMGAMPGAATSGGAPSIFTGGQ